MCCRMPDSRGRHASQRITQSLRKRFHAPKPAFRSRFRERRVKAPRLRAGSFARGKLVLLNTLVQHHRYVATDRIDGGHQALRRSTHQEE